MAKTRVRTLQVPLFLLSVHVLVSSAEGLRSAAARYGWDASEVACGDHWDAMSFDLENGSLVCVLSPDMPPDAWVRTCAHEAVHLATYVLNFTGAHDSANDETAAYLTGWLAQELYGVLCKDAPSPGRKKK